MSGVARVCQVKPVCTRCRPFVSGVDCVCDMSIICVGCRSFVSDVACVYQMSTPESIRQRRSRHRPHSACSPAGSQLSRCCSSPEVQHLASGPRAARCSRLPRTARRRTLSTAPGSPGVEPGKAQLSVSRVSVGMCRTSQCATSIGSM